MGPGRTSQIQGRSGGRVPRGLADRTVGEGLKDRGVHGGGFEGQWGASGRV